MADANEIIDCQQVADRSTDTPLFALTSLLARQSIIAGTNKVQAVTVSEHRTCKISGSMTDGGFFQDVPYFS